MGFGYSGLVWGGLVWYGMVGYGISSLHSLRRGAADVISNATQN